MLTLVDIGEVSILGEDKELELDNMVESICEVVVDGSELEITVLMVVAMTGSVLLVGLEVCGSEVVVDDGSRVSVVEEVRKTVVTAVEEVSEFEVVTDSAELVVLISVDVSLLSSEVDVSLLSSEVDVSLLSSEVDASVVSTEVSATLISFDVDASLVSAVLNSNILGNVDEA